MTTENWDWKNEKDDSEIEECWNGKECAVKNYFGLNNTVLTFFEKRT